MKHATISTPCAACKLLRRRCTQECVFAPYFPPEEPQKFAFVHRVFGASNVNKMLQDLPLHQRADAVTSMVYEAHARVRDPVYGCAGSISTLQHQMAQLQTQLALAQAEVVNTRMQRDHALISNMTNSTSTSTTLGRLTAMQGASPCITPASSSEVGQQSRPFFLQDANDSKDSLWS